MPPPGSARAAYHPILLHQPTQKSGGEVRSIRLRDGRFAFQREMERFNA
jgi:hypothetical protein